GLFVISARTTIDQSKDVVETIAQESLKLASTVTQKEMDKVKNQLLGIVERSVESIDDIGSELAIKKAVGGKIYDIDDDIALLKNVTLEQLQARAAEIFSTPPAVSAHGNNLEKLPSYEEISGAFGAVRHLDENGLLIQTEQERAAAVQRANAPGTAPATKTPSTSSPDSVDTASKESGELKPEMTVLENGLKVITIKMPTKQIYAELDAAVGDRHETAAEAGIVNVLGKLGRSASERLSVEEKGETIANLRGTSSGGVSAEHSTFNIRASNEFSEEALKILAESVTSPKLDDASIEKQKLAYKKQLIGQKNEARPNAKEQLYRLAFPGSQLDKNILSNPQAVDAISPEQLKAFREKNYTADNLTLTVVGDVDHAEIVKQAKAEFAGLAKGEAKPAVPPAKYRGGMEVKNNNEVDQVTMMIGFEGSDRSDPKTTAIDTLIGSILGGGFSSRLMSNLRTDKGYVYSVSASNAPAKDGGLFSISTWTEEKNLAPVIDEITKEVTRFASTVTQDELDVFKNDMIGNYERALASPESVGSIIGSQMANSGTLADFKEKIQNFKDVTLEDIQRRATEIFSTAPSVAAFGKGADKMPSYEEISEKFGKRRTLDASGLAVDTAPANDRSVKGADVSAQPQDKKRAIG
ncbi:MAG: insulinase family protein, partial [Alphaproteobacteria bacterium]|nr:insulinase family protein [Alphaproteobacteria bacterium]